jgi:plastocyanin
LVLRCVGAAMLVVGLLFPASTATAQVTYEVTVGGTYAVGGVSAELMRFFPADLRVHQGDVVRFTTDSFHGVAILPAGSDPTAWRLDNASARTDPWSYLQDDPDDGAGAAKYNARYFIPTRIDCGSQAAPCDVDGAGPDPYNTGAVPSGFDHSVRVTAAPGTTLWGVSLYHLHMDLRIRVVADEEQASDPAAVARAVQAQRARDVETAISLHERFSSGRSRHEDARSGRLVWDVWAGVDTEHVSLYGMYPRKLLVKRGQRVRWHFDAIENEIHNVVFPYAEAEEITFNTFQRVCDPDGDSGPGPDFPAESGEPPFCAVADQAEVDLDPREAIERGNGVLVGNSDVEASGIRGSDDLAGRDLFHEAPWDVKFRETSRRGFRYLCTIHGAGMSGRVVVEARGT